MYLFVEMFSKLVQRSSLVSSVASQGCERGVHSLPASYIKKNSWNRAVSDAEKLVGYPTSLMSVRALMDDDFANIAVHMRKLIGSEHPVLHTVKRLVYQGKNKMQLRGLLMLLLARAAGHGAGAGDVDPGTGVTEKQRKLAEIVEMINTGQAIHQSVVNLPVNIAAEEDEDTRSVLLQLEYGNKISILGGDYLLANASTGLAGLRIPRIVEMVSIAIAEFTQAEFLGQQDLQGRAVPTKDGLGLDTWETRARLGSGSLLAAGKQYTYCGIFMHHTLAICQVVTARCCLRAMTRPRSRPRVTSATVWRSPCARTMRSWCSARRAASRPGRPSASPRCPCCSTCSRTPPCSSTSPATGDILL